MGSKPRRRGKTKKIFFFVAADLRGGNLRVERGGAFDIDREEDQRVELVWEGQ